MREAESFRFSDSYNCLRVYIEQEDNVALDKYRTFRVRLSDYKMNESEFQISVWHRRSQERWEVRWMNGSGRWAFQTLAYKGIVEPERISKEYIS